MRKTYYRTIRQPELQEIPSHKRGSWVRLTDPSKEELDSLAEDLNLERDLLSDGIDLYEAPRMEHENGNIYIYIRYCRPTGEYTSTMPLLIIITPELLVTISRAEAGPVSKIVEESKIITTQKIKTVLQILSEVNKGYRQQLNVITRGIVYTRNRLQRTIVSNKDILNFIDVEEDLNEFLAALQPYGLVLHSLLNGKSINLHENDVDLIEDLELSASELTELTKSRLKTIQNMREAYNTIATNNLNTVFKRLTSIAIFMSIPTIVSGVYGMNVALPFDHSPYAFWIITGMIFGSMAAFIIYFKRKNWL